MRGPIVRRSPARNYKYTPSDYYSSAYVQTTHKHDGLVLLFLLVLGIGGFFAVRAFAKPISPASADSAVFVPTSQIKGATTCDLFDDKFPIPWWDQGFSYYRQIKITNANPLVKLTPSERVALSINHMSLINQNKAMSSGDDFRLVYLNKDGYQEVKMRVKYPRSSSTSLEFSPQKEIEPSKSDTNYYLYYGNRAAQNPPRLTSTASISAKGQLAISNESTHRFLLKSEKEWFLKGVEPASDSDASDDTSLKMRLHLAEDMPALDVTAVLQVEGTNNTGQMQKISDYLYEYTFSPKDLDPSTYNASVTITDNTGECGEARSNDLGFNVSYPVLVTWTQDWEGFDVKQEYVEDLERMADKYDMPITHYWNPRIYIPGVMSASRQEYLTKWVKGRRDNYGEEIALHLHMYNNLLSTVGVPNHGIRWGQNQGSGNAGYDTLTGEFSTPNMAKILNWSKSKFKEKGLGIPDNYRAGGWFTSLKTLEALEQTGFRIDSSGREAYTLFGKKGYWDLKATTQPYHPSKRNQNSPNPAPRFELWEVPNNGGNSWAHDEDDMLGFFKQNYRGGIAKSPVVFTLLSHPHWHDTDAPRIENVLTFANGYKYQRDRGPVMYVTVSDAVDVWEKIIEN